jgi:hypothetical protein
MNASDAYANYLAWLNDDSTGAGSEVNPDHPLKTQEALNGMRAKADDYDGMIFEMGLVNFDLLLGVNVNTIVCVSEQNGKSGGIHCIAMDLLQHRVYWLPKSKEYLLKGSYDMWKDTSNDQYIVDETSIYEGLDHMTTIGVMTWLIGAKFQPKAKD